MELSINNGWKQVNNIVISLLTDTGEYRKAAFRFKSDIVDSYSSHDNKIHYIEVGVQYRDSFNPNTFYCKSIEEYGEIMDWLSHNCAEAAKQVNDIGFLRLVAIAAGV